MFLNDNGDGYPARNEQDEGENQTSFGISWLQRILRTVRRGLMEPIRTMTASMRRKVSDQAAPVWEKTLFPHEGGAEPSAIPSPFSQVPQGGFRSQLAPSDLPPEHAQVVMPETAGLEHRGGSAPIDRLLSSWPSERDIPSPEARIYPRGAEDAHRSLTASDWDDDQRQEENGEPVTPPLGQTAGEGQPSLRHSTGMTTPLNTAVHPAGETPGQQMWRIWRQVITQPYPQASGSMAENHNALNDRADEGRGIGTLGGLVGGLRKEQGDFPPPQSYDFLRGGAVPSFQDVSSGLSAGSGASSDEQWAGWDTGSHVSDPGRDRQSETGEWGDDAGWGDDKIRRYEAVSQFTTGLI